MLVSDIKERMTLDEYLCWQQYWEKRASDTGKERGKVDLLNPDNAALFD